MPLLPDLSQRCYEPELMDSPDGDQQALFNTLRQFRAINRWLTPCHRLIRQHFIAPMKREPQRAWSFLDVGAGGGDLAIWLAEQCRRLKISVDITCLDRDPRTCEFARDNCRAFENITVLQSEAKHLGAGDRRYDFVFSNHFLHHLDDEQIVDVLRAIDDVAVEHFVICDLHRALASYVGFSSLLPLRLANDFIWEDGRLSIRRALTVADCHRLLDAAGLNRSVRIQRSFPGHLTLIGK